MFHVSFVKDVLSLAAQQQGAFPWWVWFLVIVIIILLFILLWRWLGLSKGGDEAAFPVDAIETKQQQAIPAPAAPEKAADVPAVVSPASFSVPDVEHEPVAVAPTPQPVAAPKPDDDLTLIEGIGPKIASALQTAGITSFDQLANADLPTLETILRNANLRLADPASWAEQATLAAHGKLDELKILQNSLKGGRRV